MTECQCISGRNIGVLESKIETVFSKNCNTDSFYISGLISNFQRGNREERDETRRKRCSKKHLRILSALAVKTWGNCVEAVDADSRSEYS